MQKMFPFDDNIMVTIQNDLTLVIRYEICNKGYCGIDFLD